MTQMAASVVRERFVGDLALPRYELGQWWEEYGIRAGITGRENGFDLGLWSDEQVGAVMTRWRAFRQAMGDGFEGVVLSHQRHGTAIGTHERPVRGLLIEEGLDGHMTRAPGLLLSVTVADCIPVYLLEPRSGWMALLHAGWRGIADGILESAVGLLVERSGSDSSDLLMHCGVGICSSCYEVGPEVLERVNGCSSSEPGRLDLRAALAERAAGLGLRHLTLSPWCSAHDRGRFYSHRSSEGHAGRMLAYLGRPAT